MPNHPDLMSFLNFLHVTSAYTGLLSVILFLILYSKAYNWHKHPLGLVMNLSLIANAVVALGAIINNGFPMFTFIGKGLVTVGWLAFTALLVMRLRLLIVTRPTQEEVIQVPTELVSELDAHAHEDGFGDSREPNVGKDDTV